MRTTEPSTTSAQRPARSKAAASPYGKAPAQQLPYASIAARLKAFVVDGLLLGFILITLHKLLTPASGNTTLQPWLTIGLGCLLVPLYFALMEGSPYKASLGKKGNALRVTTPEGAPVGWGRAWARNLLKLLSTLPALAGFALALFSPQRQTLHDRLAGTVVLHQPRRQGQPPGSPAALPYAHGFDDGPGGGLGGGGDAGGGGADGA
jgi:uncharacterized RDD family membrane protein YckC